MDLLKYEKRLVKHLGRKFGVSVSLIKPIHRGVYQISTIHNKKYCLKRMAYSISHIRWIDKTLKLVKQHGFERIVWRNSSQPEGKKLYVRSNNNSMPYLLHPWVKGRWPHPKSKEDMRDCAILLAQFHQVGRKFVPPKGGHDMIGKWPALFREQHNLLKKAVEKASKKRSTSPLNRLLVQYGEETLQRSRTAISILRQSDYYSACRAARSEGSLCHGDGGPSNFIIHSKGMSLIDFETLRLDLPAYDLYRVIHNSCKDYNWDFTIARNLLEGYSSVTELTKIDYELLKVWLRFPRGICKIVRRYERSRKKKELEQQFLACVKEDRMKDAFLDRLDRFYRKDNDG